MYCEMCYIYINLKLTELNLLNKTQVCAEIPQTKVMQLFSECAYCTLEERVNTDWHVQKHSPVLPSFCFSVSSINFVLLRMPTMKYGQTVRSLYKRCTPFDLGRHYFKSAGPNVLSFNLSSATVFHDPLLASGGIHQGYAGQLFHLFST